MDQEGRSGDDERSVATRDRAGHLAVAAGVRFLDKETGKLLIFG